MRITLKLFASLDRYLPAGARHNQVVCELPEGSTVNDLLTRLGLPAAQVHLVLVNGHFVSPARRKTRAIVEGDVVAMWPPVAGG